MISYLIFLQAQPCEFPLKIFVELIRILYLVYRLSRSFTQGRAWMFFPVFFSVFSIVFSMRFPVSFLICVIAHIYIMRRGRGGFTFFRVFQPLFLQGAHQFFGLFPLPGQGQPASRFLFLHLLKPCR